MPVAQFTDGEEPGTPAARFTDGDEVDSYPEGRLSWERAHGGSQLLLGGAADEGRAEEAALLFGLSQRAPADNRGPADCGRQQTDGESGRAAQAAGGQARAADHSQNQTVRSQRQSAGGQAPIIGRPDPGSEQPAPTRRQSGAIIRESGSNRCSAVGANQQGGKHSRRAIRTGRRMGKDDTGEADESAAVRKGGRKARCKVTWGASEWRRKAARWAHRNGDARQHVAARRAWQEQQFGEDGGEEQTVRGLATRAEEARGEVVTAE